MDPLQSRPVCQLTFQVHCQRAFQPVNRVLSLLQCPPLTHLYFHPHLLPRGRLPSRHVSLLDDLLKDLVTIRQRNLPFNQRVSLLPSHQSSQVSSRPRNHLASPRHTQQFIHPPSRQQFLQVNLLPSRRPPLLSLYIRQTE